jgi:HK97 family phage major capsid protein
MADVDVAHLCTIYDVRADHTDPRGTLAKLLEAMHAEGRGGRAGIQGRSTLGVDPGGRATAALLRSIGDEGAFNPGAEPRDGVDSDLPRIVKSRVEKSSKVPSTGRDLREVLARPAGDEDELALQRWNDNCHLLSRVLDLHPKRLNYFADVLQRNDRLAKSAVDAMTSGDAGYGAEWVPTAFSAALWTDIRLAAKVAAAFVQIDMPTLSYKSPYATGHTTCYLTSEATDLTPAHVPTGAATLTAKGMGAALEFSGELTEDSIIPTLPMATEDMVQTLAEHLDTSIINGDTTSPHFDGAAVNLGAADTRRAWKGLRRLTHDASLLTSLSTLTAEALLGLRGGMGVYGVDPAQLVMIASPRAYIKLLSLKDSANNAVVLGMDKIGAAATILTGMLGSLWGIPILVSAQSPEWEGEATGYYEDGGGDPPAAHWSSIIVANRRAFLVGHRRPVAIESARFILGDWVLVVGRQRVAFSPRITCGATRPCAYRGIGVDVS